VHSSALFVGLYEPDTIGTPFGTDPAAASLKVRFAPAALIPVSESNRTECVPSGATSNTSTSVPAPADNPVNVAVTPVIEPVTPLEIVDGYTAAGCPAQQSLIVAAAPGKMSALATATNGSKPSTAAAATRPPRRLKLTTA
jgi:hypothetical protein